MQKPRPYNGPVEWLAEAEEYAATWPRDVLRSVQAHNPYRDHNCTGVRPEDWLKLVAHVSLRRREAPLMCADRLNLYVTTYRETHMRTLHPETVRDGQEPEA